METSDNSQIKNIPNKEKEEISYIKCTYDIKDNNETQIMNFRSETYVNEEIEKKVKILNNGQKEKLVFKKKFDKPGINTVDFIIEGKLINMSYLFYKCPSLKEVKFISMKTDETTKMRAIFVECSNIEYLDLTSFDTSKVTDISFMFYECNNLKEIKGMNTFDTSNVTVMYEMFEGCKSFKYLDLSNFNTKNVTNMEGMFQE